MIKVAQGFSDKSKYKFQQIYALMDTVYRPMTEGYMKVNKPWTTRTGLAVAGLHSRIEKSETEIKLILGHGVSYGVYLELGHKVKTKGGKVKTKGGKVKTKGGKVKKVKPYAILKPTMDKFYPDICERIRELWSM